MNLKSIKVQAIWRLIVNWIIVVLFGILFQFIKPAPESEHISLGILATVLALLNAGVFTSYSSLSIIDAPKSSIRFYNIIDTFLFCCMYLLIYLAIYCIYRIGIFLDKLSFIEVLLHFGIGFLLSVMHFIDVWDRVQCEYTIRNET